MTLTKAGNVGIGWTYPYGLLQVGGTSTSPGLIVKATNLVGIATTEPQFDLHVAGTAAAKTLRFGTSLDNILPAGTGTTGQALIASAAGAIIWANTSAGGGGGGGWADDGTMVRLSAPTDNVGIGRSDPLAKLHIYGSATTNNFALRISDSLAADKLVVLDRGNVGIGTTAPSEPLHVNGAIQIDGSGDSFLGGKLGLGISVPAYTLHVVGTAAVNTLIIGANTQPIYNMIKGFGTWPATTLVGGTGAGASLNITTTGASMGDVAMVGFSSIPSGTLVVSALVVSANTTRVTVKNQGGNTSSVSIVAGTTTTAFVLDVM
jgi:hypothetical protein